MEKSDITIRNAAPQLYESVKQLCDESFGTGYVDRGEYEKWLLHPDLFNTAFVDDDFAGYSVMIPAGTEEIMRYMGMERSEVLAITGDSPALIYKSVAVRSVYRKQGLLTELVNSLLGKAKDLGYGSVLLSAWMYNGKTPVESTLLSLGFTRLFERHLLWYQFENYKCVICGGRCVCDATIYYKNL